MAPAAHPRTVVTRAPTRIDLGGGWTDVPPYSDVEGGFVCNVAINRYATARIAYDESRSAARQPTPITRVSTDQELIVAVLRRSGITNVQVSLTSDFPVGAGLGGSSAASAALLGAIATWRDERLDRRAIAEEGRRIEVEDLRIAGGRQDHYAATHGGALALRFGEAVQVKHLTLSAATREALERRSLLVHTGQSRTSGETITAVMDAYRAGDARVLSALAQMRSLAMWMATALELGDIDQVGALVGEHWTHQRTLHPAIPTPRIDEIVARAAASGACGAKAMGASGGGCVLVIAGKDNVEEVRAAVAKLGTVLSFEIDVEGLAQCG